MKIKEIAIVGSKISDTTSSGTTSSGQPVGSPQDIVPDMIDNKVLCQPDHSAIAEGVSQIFRRKKGGMPTKGFRCTTGPRKGRIVAKPSTCFQKTDPQRSAKIRKVRQRKARIAGKKLGITKRSGAGSVRLKKAQIKKGGGRKPVKSKSKTVKAKAPQKSKTVKSKKK